MAVKSNLQRLIDRMRSLAPDQYDQVRVTHANGTMCGTAACIAGHAYGLIRREEVGAVLYYQDEEIAGEYDQEAWDEAQAWLCLTDYQADMLFAPRPPADYQTPSLDDAVRTLERFRDTGVIDWSRHTV